MFRSRWSSLGSTSRSVPDITPDRILGILTNSHVVPLGKLTDHFDKNMKSYFSSQENKRSLVSALLAEDVIEQKLKVPKKVRENILMAVSERFDSLNTGELVRIPSLLRRLPKTMMSSESENALLEKLLKRVSIDLLRDLPTERLSHLIRDVARLHIKHPCKDEFVVRFFESLSPASLESKTRLALLEFAAQTLSTQKLAHPLIRKTLIYLLQSLDEFARPGETVLMCSSLPIFPDALEILDAHILSRRLQVNTGDTDDSIKGCLGLLGIQTSPSMLSTIGQELLDQVRKSGCTSALLEGVVDFPKQRFNAEFASKLIDCITANEACTSLASIGGYVRLLLAADVPQERLNTDMKILLSNLSSSRRSEDLLPMAYILRGLSISESDKSISSSLFKDHIAPHLEHVCPAHVRIMLTSDNEWLGSKIIEVSSDPAVLVAVLSITGQSAAAEKLSKIVPSVSNTERLLGMWNTLTDSGTAFANPDILASDSPRKRALKEVTRAIFRSVRMAPIPIVQ
jgi:hypothetical protein